MRKWRLYFLIIIISCVAPFLPVAAPVQADSISLTILHTNDLHGHLLPYLDERDSGSLPEQAARQSSEAGHSNGPDRAGSAEWPSTPAGAAKVGGMAYLASIVDLERKGAPLTLLLDAGDIAQGTPISNFFQGKPVVEIMNLLRYDAMELGNHEFDWGKSPVHRMIGWASFPVLCANLVQTGNRRGFPGTSPYIIKEVGQLKVGILGLITPETPVITMKGNTDGLTFLPPEEIAGVLVPAMKERGANIVVVLSHLGVEGDRALARSVPGIDVIVGGHSHTVLREAILEGETIIVQTGSYGKYLGKLVLHIEEGKRRAFSYQLIPVDPARQLPLPPVAQMIGRYSARIAPVVRKVVGISQVDLLRSREGESNLGDLICDAMRLRAGAQMSFHNRGGIRSNLFRGKVTFGDLFTVLPFDNRVVTMSLAGSEILEILEHSIGISPGMLQTSGIKILFDSSRPAGKKVVHVMVGQKPLLPASRYVVATNDFLASGGDGFEEFMRGRRLKDWGLLREVVAKYLSDHSPITIGVDGRIRERKGQKATLPNGLLLTPGQTLYRERCPAMKFHVQSPGRRLPYDWEQLRQAAGRAHGAHATDGPGQSRHREGVLRHSSPLES